MGATTSKLPCGLVELRPNVPSISAERAHEIGNPFTAAQVHAVLEAQMTYLESIGAIGPEAPPNELG